ncbi:MAG TPA: hypothetical protein VF950_30170 [Planctomycetota bacterium]
MGRRVEWYLGSADGLASHLASPAVLDRLESQIGRRLVGRKPEEPPLFAPEDPGYVDALELLRKLRREGPSALKVSSPAEARAADIVHYAFMYLAPGWKPHEGGLEDADEATFNVFKYSDAFDLIKSACAREMEPIWEHLLYGRLLWSFAGPPFPVPYDSEDPVTGSGANLGYWTATEARFVLEQLEAAFGPKIDAWDFGKDDHETDVLTVIEVARRAAGRASAGGRGLILKVV